jgi:glycosyltransferase involved in cell wall biosynthesis
MPGGRVLAIAHHFPPAGGSGSNRALAFARYLPQHGWTPIVLTPGVEWAINKDDRLLAEVPPDVSVIRTRSFEPRPPVSPTPSPRGDRGPIFASSRRPSALRSHLGHLKRFPDVHLGWLPFAFAAARKQNYDVAYSSSGPFTSHLVGLLLKRLTNKPWVAELRDGWYRWNRAIFPDYPAWRSVLERHLEAAAMRTADRVVLVTERMARAFRCQYTDLPADHFAVVSNGFDASQLEQHVRSRRHAGFEVLHAGALYYGRSVAAFLEGAAHLVQTEPDFRAAFRLTLLGTLDATARTEVANGALQGHVWTGGQVDHSATLQAMHSADMLLLVANTTPGAEATVPGKLFEYLAVGRPVLAVAPADSATADVLKQTGGGSIAPANDPASIACVLRRAFEAHQAGIASPADPRQLARFDRRVLAGNLATILEHATRRT